MSADRIRLPIDFDTGKLLADIENMDLGDFIYYDVLPLPAPAHLVDPARPAPPASEDYADGSWTEWLDTSREGECRDRCDSLERLLSPLTGYRGRAAV